MENLLVLLDKIQHISPLPIFTQEVIVVQNAGMQHWLNLSLAQQRGISMNVGYALPAQFLWKLLRAMASDEDIPEQSPYSREVLSWRVHALLASKTVVDDPDFSSATHYWQGKVAAKNSGNKAALKRFQLACQLADLYEQYLIFRPDWINEWHQGHHKISDKYFVCSSSKEESTELSHWQSKLWQLLIKEQAYNPVSLMQDAINNIGHKKQLLPARISFFGINAMAPMWLEFIHALSEHIDVHFFHLNPCYQYWGDIVTEKQALKAITDWVDGYDDVSQALGNPLLANLGQQGREFMALLTQYSTLNIDAFEGIPAHNEAEQPSVLHTVQQDILQLRDAREQPVALVDDSIVITSCHSALREVQALHDWLLHQFNQDKRLTPKDVLVMCPQIEHYAPYVSAVFTRGWQDIDDKIPPLPCSIADRNSIDSEPLIAAFSEILNLPDSRFQVSQLIGFLRLPAMQLKFDINLDDLDKITLWLEQAAIHWGLDADHKAKMLNVEQATSSFTWQQGLTRLARGFAFGDVETIYQEQLILPTVEGDNALLLGKLMLIIEQLQQFSAQLTQHRTASQWQMFLFNIVNELFAIDSDTSLRLISQAIESLVEYCQHAKYDGEIELEVIRYFLNSHFSQPDPGRQFMVGQVTFCSMLPMRSIPFKVIAVLGLNDGEYPRQRQPLGFDLIDMTRSQLGDRSRRGDDRYLFLEAMISARQALYLSFQGRNIKTNTPRQASLVLKELMEYLQLGYGWSFAETPNSQLRQMPMQSFSEKNYRGDYPSFDGKWLALQQAQPPLANQQSVKINSTEQEPVLTLTADSLIRFYQHPAKYYAQHLLNLFFDDNAVVLDDAEPFKYDYLQTYLLREQLLAAYLTTDSDNEQAAATVLKHAQLAGKFPDLPTNEAMFSQWQQDSELFSQLINDQISDDYNYLDCAVTLTMPPVADEDALSIHLKARVCVQAQQLVFYRSSSAKPKDLFNQYLHALIVQVWQQQHQNDNSEQAKTLANISCCLGFYFDTKSQKTTQYSLDFLANEDSISNDSEHVDASAVSSTLLSPEQRLIQLLSLFLKGQEQALLLNGTIAEKLFTSKSFEQTDFEKLWYDSNGFTSMAEDPYLHYFWSECPQLDDIKADLIAVYKPMYHAFTKETLTRVETGEQHD